MRFSARNCAGVLVAGMASLLLLGGCVSTEPLVRAPHINLSPENMSLVDAAANGQLDFGLNVSVNESDSLDNLAVLPGLRVRSVRGGSAADLAGIRSGDILLSINGIETNQPDVLATLAEASDSEEFQVTARRGTTVYETTLARPSQRLRSTPRERYRADPVKSRAGYATELVELSGGEQRTVARIAELFPHSPLTGAGLRVNDIIVTLDGESIQSAQDLVNRFNNRPAGERVNLAVIAESDSERRVQDISLNLWEPERRISSLAAWPLFRYESSLAPEQVEFTILDLIVFSLFSYQRQGGERTYRLLGIFRFGSGYGELIEENSAADASR
ncbi:MAG: PDZ domain-containing protein [Cellvibrionaceae bacterium]